MLDNLNSIMIGTNTIPSNEEDRLHNLKKYNIMYTKSEPIFEQLAALAATMLNAPIAMINFVDRHKVWTKADQNGIGGYEMDRLGSLCSLAILSDKVTVYEDVTKQLLFISNPIIAGGFRVKFYAAAAITTEEGYNVGSVCIIDKIARTFSAGEQRKLEWVAAMVSAELRKRVTSVAEVA